MNLRDGSGRNWFTNFREYSSLDRSAKFAPQSLPLIFDMEKGGKRSCNFVNSRSHVLADQIVSGGQKLP